MPCFYSSTKSKVLIHRFISKCSGIVSLKWEIQPVKVINKQSIKRQFRKKTTLAITKSGDCAKVQEIKIKTCQWINRSIGGIARIKKSPKLGICKLDVERFLNIFINIIRVFFSLGLPLKVPSTEKFFSARLCVSRTIYVNVDSPNLGFPYFNFLGEAQWKQARKPRSYASLKLCPLN